jgi:hypothetical protein
LEAAAEFTSPKLAFWEGADANAMSALCQKETHAVQQKLFDDLVGKWGCAARAQPAQS